MPIQIDLSGCPRTLHPTTMTVTECLEAFRGAYRLGFINSSADIGNIFTGVDAAAQTTDIETLGTWTTAKANVDPDKVILTPQIAGVTSTPGGEVTETFPDGTVDLVDYDPSQYVFTFKGLSSNDEYELRKLSGSGWRFVIFDKFGNLFAQDVALDVGGVVGTRQVFFPLNYISFGDRTITTRETDANVLTISTGYGAISQWKKYNTSAFGLTI